MTQRLFERDITQLRELLTEELRLVSTYVDAIDRSESSYVCLMLTDLAKSHAARVRLLRDRLAALGHHDQPNGQPASRLNRDAPSRTGLRELARDAGALGSLLEAEDRLQDLYHTVGQRLSAETRSYLDDRISSEQRRAHLGVRQLTQQVHPQATAMPW